MPTNQEILTTAEALLSRRFGGTQALTGHEELSGSGNAIVLRGKLAANPFLPERSVVVKYVPVTDDALDDAALVRELVAYQFTTSLGEAERPGPVLLAYDVADRIIVISDSGNGDTFAELLATGDAEQRVHILRNLGEALGLMHAGTASRESDFEALRARMARQHPKAFHINRYRTKAKEHAILHGVALLRDAGITVPDGVEALAREAVRRLRGGQRAFTPFDLSPDNIIVAQRTHFLDYEWAGFRDTAYDLGSVIAGFPQFLLSRPISDDEADVFLEAWANKVGSIWPDARDEDALQLRLVTALLGLALTEVTVLHLGTTHNLVHEVAASAGEADLISLQPEDITPVSRLFATAGSTPLSRSEAILRRDLFDTFEALARYAVRAADPRLGVVARFADEIAALLNDAGAEE